MAMKTVKIASLIIAQVLMTLLTAATLFMLYAMLGMMLKSGDRAQDSQDVQLYVRSNGFHTDICLPVKNEVMDWTRFISTSDYPLNRSFNYIAIGWGDHDFYVNAPKWEDVTVGLTLHSLFLPTTSALHVEYMEYQPQASDYCVELEISNKNYASLVNYVEESFLMEQGYPEVISETTYWGRDHFYAAKNSYHLFQTCNSWTNGALKAAGVKTVAWAVFPGTIMSCQK